MNKRVAVLVSGTGSLLDAMIKDGLPIALVLADRDCRGLKIADEAQIPARLIDRKKWGFGSGTYPFRRDEYTGAVTETLLRNDIQLVVMAGFMTIFSPQIFEYFEGRVLNSHPSLLPAFKGESAVADALAYGARVTGTTIHIATKDLDDGPILAQVPVLVLPGDTVETLWERIKVVERGLYPQVIREFAQTL